MRRSSVLFALVSVAAIAAPASAAIVNVNLAGAVTGTTITGVGASFTQRFAGQTVVGTGITGSPTNPLTLSAAGTIEVASFNPGVSAESNSLLSQPGNAAPLSILLASNADSITFTSGSFDGGTIFADFFSSTGALVATRSFTGSGYSIFSFSGLGTFRGITFRDNSDGAGVRFQNFSYNSVAAGGVPEPASWAMMIAGFGLAGTAMRRRATVRYQVA